ncbi:GNAT family N-acetyltransferase [Fontisubflavum oceani]|uniref:GNAT family N-acetyltransferase n=1 Tax=Fontisubflavum oceani TaxID=2978973 RepID=UPI0025B351F8|nr:GNAT family N-acetyltransferase [Fontisubflavum oceani]WJY21441.1 GNAT family N-acetyltransferase [Fontisubflavum oceani]
MTVVLRTTELDPIFRTARLTCRPVEASDAPFYADLFSRQELVAYRPDPTPFDAARSATRLGEDLAHWKQHGFGRWALVHAGRTVGLGGLSLKFQYRGINLSYHLLPDLWGQGLASEFVRGALDYAALSLKAQEVYGLVRPANTASTRVLEKAGFIHAAEHMVSGAPMTELRLKLR